MKDKMLYVQAGVDIVADSAPDSEWMETENKARAEVLDSLVRKCIGRAGHTCTTQAQVN